MKAEEAPCPQFPKRKLQHRIIFVLDAGYQAVKHVGSTLGTNIFEDHHRNADTNLDALVSFKSKRIPLELSRNLSPGLSACAVVPKILGNASKPAEMFGCTNN